MWFLWKSAPLWGGFFVKTNHLLQSCTLALISVSLQPPDIREACRALGADRVFDKSSELEELIGYCETLGA